MNANILKEFYIKLKIRKKIKDLKSINKEDIIIDNQIINNFSNQKLHQF